MRFSATELAKLMLELGDLKREVADREEVVKDAVLATGQTQTVGNVRATYSAGRKTYDWESAGKTAAAVGALSAQIVSDHTTLIPASEKVDWRTACQDVGIEDVPFTQSEPSVTIKLLDTNKEANRG